MFTNYANPRNVWLDYDNNVSNVTDLHSFLMIPMMVNSPFLANFKVPSKFKPATLPRRFLVTRVLTRSLSTRRLMLPCRLPMNQLWVS